MATLSHSKNPFNNRAHNPLKNFLFNNIHSILVHKSDNSSPTNNKKNQFNRANVWAKSMAEGQNEGRRNRREKEPAAEKGKAELAEKLIAQSKRCSTEAIGEAFISKWREQKDESEQRETRRSIAEAAGARRPPRQLSVCSECVSSQGEQQTGARCGRTDGPENIAQRKKKGR
jgi:hypothetical protein